jgi:hypothetical protein
MLAGSSKHHYYLRQRYDHVLFDVGSERSLGKTIQHCTSVAYMGIDFNLLIFYRERVRTLTTPMPASPRHNSNHCSDASRGAINHTQEYGWSNGTAAQDQTLQYRIRVKIIYSGNEIILETCGHSPTPKLGFA